MAIAFDASSTRGSSWDIGASGPSWTHTCTGSNRLLVVAVGMYGTSRTVTGITYNGVALTQLSRVTQTLEASNQSLDIWYLVAPATGANTLTVSLSGSADYFVGFVQSYTGVNQSTPFGTPNTTSSGSSTSGSPACTVTSAYSNSWLVGAGYSRAATLSAGAGTTVRQAASGLGAGDSNGTISGTAGLAYTGATAAVWPGVIVAEMLDVSPAGAGTPPGIATETDAALALAGKQIRAAGMATETDTALALVTLAGLPFNTAPYEFGQRTGLDVDDFSIYASTSLNVSVYAATDVLLASQLFAYAESTGSDGRLTRKTHASLTAGTVYIFVAVTTGGALVAAGRITAT